jgi:NAD(P)-dependent dehydrogenase (short-subunit alcohol dehydrogenase family)
VLVTGASRGIGRAVARRLLDEGREVVLVLRHGVASDLDAPVVRADLTVDRDVVARACEPFGGLDAIVHAAGVAPHAPLEAITEAQLERVWSLHVVASLRLTQDLAAHLRAEKRPGSIVHVASTLAFRPAPTTIAYAASKAALIAMAKGAALELAPDRIRVNVVAPGIVDTDMVRALRLAPGEPVPQGDEHARRVEAQLEAMRRMHPLGRLGEPREIADAVVYLLDAEWVTGTVLTIDGGLTAG